THGLTTLRMDNGEKCVIPKQILQSQKIHAILEYKNRCEEDDFEPFGIRKLYDILNSINPSEQKVLSGLDEFVTEGVEAWDTLSGRIRIVHKFAIPQNERKCLQKQIQVAEMYQKSRYAGHCSLTSDCVTHCITFGLSDPSSPDFETKCQYSHTTSCSDYVNIFNALDEIEKNNKRDK
ncbi:unnamed protein product, partial [Didymodactylos carnosus]